MPDDISDILDYYNDYVEQENGRLERHQIERDVTWRFLDKYLPRQGNILELGCATGAYTIPLAKRGYNVTAVDITPNLLAECQRRVVKAKLGGKVTCYIADARDLSAIRGENYDVVMIMGPLYHLVLEEDRIKALQEAHARLKPGGVVFSAFVSRYGIWNSVMKKSPRMIESQDDVWSNIKTGRDSDHPSPDIHFRAYMADPAEINTLHKKTGFRKLVLAGVEATGIDELYNNLEHKQKKLWLDLMVALSTEKSIVGASCHLLYVGQKKKVNA
jgi:S-adenosylmethionine-dependent methyltransferase